MVSMKGKLYVYETSFNNGKRAIASLRSIAPLKPAGIYITDNLSYDGSYELMKKYPGVHIKQIKSRRGDGRGRALNEILKVAAPTDCVIHIDPDVIYKKKFIKFIKQHMNTVKDGELYADMGSLSTIKTNYNLPWPPINASEDTERLARAAKMGLRIYRFKVDNEMDWDDYWDNERLPRGDKRTDREARFETTALGKYIRFAIHVVDDQRGMAKKSFREYYNLSTNKNPLTWLIYFVGYYTAAIMGVYRHSKQYDNPEFVRRSSTFIKRP